jgi:hypothetical protein
VGDQENPRMMESLAKGEMLGERIHQRYPKHDHRINKKEKSVMPQYEYPLRLSKMVSRIAIPSFPIEVANHDGVALFVGREKLRIFFANSIHVFSAATAGKKEAEQYQILDHSEQGVDRGFRFVSSADRLPVGKILQHKRNEMVLIDISDPYGKPVASAADNVYERLKAVMKSFVSGGSKKVLDTTSPLQFRSASQAPMFSLVPLDTKGSTQLTLESPEVSAEHEKCILLSAITLMFWWQHDESAGS